MKDSPDAAHILADLVGVRALQLAQLRIPLNLEEHLFARLGRHLCVPQNAAVSPRVRLGSTNHVR